MNKVILLNNRPQGKPKNSDFQMEEIDEPQTDLKKGEVLLESIYISVDPYLRGRMRDQKSYIEPFEVGKPIASNVIAKVLKSNDSELEEGDHVNGMLDWKLKQVSNGDTVQKVDGKQVPLSAYLGVLGLTGLTAYFGLEKVGKPEDGETLLVSGASGAVGSIVGQIGKVKGCRVVGIAGSDEKVQLMKEKFGFDAGINYKTTDDMASAVAENCPEGVDVYFDNVGGEILDAALENMNDFGRVVNCGAISLYNETGQPTGPRPEPTLVKKRIKMQGILVRDHLDESQAAVQQLGEWLKEGKLTHEETIVEGFDNTPDAFIGLFDGENKGKMVVKV